MHATSRILSAWRLPALALMSLLAASPVLSQSAPPEAPLPRLDVPYVPTPHEAVYRMLELVQVQPDDYVIDLGSGDGRIVVAAARDWGVKRSLGIDIDPERVAEANENARRAGVEDRVTFELGDLFQKDFSDVDVLTMYLLPTINVKLRPVILEKLRPGTRIVSHAFDMGDWRPDAWIEVQGRYVYKWIVPANVGGTWQITRADGSSFNIEIEQKYQILKGTSQINNMSRPLAFLDIRGDTVRFSREGEHYTGRVDGDRIIAQPGTATMTGWHAKRL